MQQQLDPQQLLFDEHQAFYDPFYPFKPLDNYHALHYFEHSPFIDRNSNNNTARHDLQDINRPEVQCRYPTDTTEYIVAESVPPHLFVVRKQQRTSAGGAGAKTTVHNYYYILNQHAPHIYQAPTLHAAINNKLRRAMHFVKDGFSRFKADCAPLPKVLREHQKEQEALQQQQLEKVAELDADADGLGLTSLNRTENLLAPGGATGAAAAAAAAVKPMVVMSDPPKDQLRQWERTDRMIARVFDKYPHPFLPPSKAEVEAKKELEEQQRQQQGEAKQQQQQQGLQQQQQQPAAPPPAASISSAEQATAVPASVPAATAAAPAAAAAPEVSQVSKKRRIQATSTDLLHTAGATGSAPPAAAGGARVLKTSRSASADHTASAGEPAAAAAAAAARPAGSDYSQGSMGVARSHGLHGAETSTGRAAAAAAGVVRRRTPPPGQQQQLPPQQQQQQQGMGVYRPVAAAPVAGPSAMQLDPAAAAAAPVAVPTRSASYGGLSAMSHGTAATAASTGGNKMKLKLKIKKQPAPWQQQQQGGQQGGPQQ